MGLPVVTVAAGGLPIVEATYGTPVTEAANGYGVPVTKVIGKPGLPVVFETIGVVAPFVPATWDAADVSQVTLSNGNKTATSINVGYARSRPSPGNGRYYWEITISTWASGNTGPYFGSAATAIPTNGIAGLSKDGNVWVDFNPSGNLGARAAGDTLGVAVNLTAKLIWFRVAPSGNWNGSGTANPTTGVGGRDIAPLAGSLKPSVALGGVGEVATANFGASAFVGAVPSGFISGWPA